MNELVDAVRGILGLDSISESTKSHLKGQLICARCFCKFIRESRNVHGGRQFCSIACNSSYYGRERAGKIEHGTTGRYRKGCRCAECRYANTERCRIGRQKRHAKRREEP